MSLASRPFEAVLDGSRVMQFSRRARTTSDAATRFRSIGRANLRGRTTLPQPRRRATAVLSECCDHRRQRRPADKRPEIPPAFMDPRRKSCTPPARSATGDDRSHRSSEVQSSGCDRSDSVVIGLRCRKEVKAVRVTKLGTGGRISASAPRCCLFWTQRKGEDEAIHRLGTDGADVVRSTGHQWLRPDPLRRKHLHPTGRHLTVNEGQAPGQLAEAVSRLEMPEKIVLLAADGELVHPRPPERSWPALVVNNKTWRRRREVHVNRPLGTRTAGGGHAEQSKACQNKSIHRRHMAVLDVKRKRREPQPARNASASRVRARRLEGNRRPLGLPARRPARSCCSRDLLAAPRKDGGASARQ